jgi:hypothetical protein
MKKIIVILLVMVMMFSLCACGADDNPEEVERIGYVIIPHADGEERVDITSCVGSNGIIVVKTVDGKKIVSPLLIAVLEK